MCEFKKNYFFQLIDFDEPWVKTSFCYIDENILYYHVIVINAGVTMCLYSICTAHEELCIMYNSEEPNIYKIICVNHATKNSVSFSQYFKNNIVLPNHIVNGFFKRHNVFNMFLKLSKISEWFSICDLKPLFEDLPISQNFEVLQFVM